MRHSLDPTQSILSHNEQKQIFTHSYMTSQQMIQIQNSIEQNVFDGPDLQKVLHKKEQKMFNSRLLEDS